MRPKHGHFCPVVFQIPQTSFCVIDILALPLGEHVDSAIQLVLCFGQVLVTTAVAMAATVTAGAVVAINRMPCSDKLD